MILAWHKKRGCSQQETADYWNAKLRVSDIDQKKVLFWLKHENLWQQQVKEDPSTGAQKRQKRVCHPEL